MEDVDGHGPCARLLGSLFRLQKRHQCCVTMNLKSSGCGVHRAKEMWLQLHKASKLRLVGPVCI